MISIWAVEEPAEVTAALRMLAERDRVTFIDTNGALIHAWGDAKAVEYLCAAVRACPAQAVKP